MLDGSISKKEKRPYRSQARKRFAEETRRRILAATRQLFTAKGYAGTTIEAIAEEAEVSPKTVSAVFGSKRAILAEVVNPGAFGPDVQRLIEAVRTTVDPAKRIALVAQITRQAYEPMTVEMELLRTAPGVAPELAELSKEIEMRRRENQGRLIKYLAENGYLRSGLGQEQAMDVVWALTSFDLYRMLVIERHWPAEEYEAWLANLLSQHLLQPTHT